MGKASKDGVPKERAEKPKGGVDWSQHEQLYKKMKDEEKSLKQWNPLEDIRVQFVVGVATALFLTYHAFTAGGITQLTKANTIEAFKTGEPWLVLCDKQPVKAAVTKEPIGVDFAEAADRLTDIGVQSGVLNCWGKLSTGQTAMKKYGLKPHGSKPFIFLMDPDFKVKKTGTLKPIQLGSKDMKSADKIVEIVTKQIKASQKVKDKKKKKNSKGKKEDKEPDFDTSTKEGRKAQREHYRKKNQEEQALKLHRKQKRAKKEAAAKKAKEETKKKAKEQESKSTAQEQQTAREQAAREARVREKMEKEQRAQYAEAADPEDGETDATAEVEEDEEVEEVVDLDDEDGEEEGDFLHDDAEGE